MRDLRWERQELLFEMHKTDIGVHGRTLRKMVGLGAPIALQDLLVSISFLIILAIAGRNAFCFS